MNIIRDFKDILNVNLLISINMFININLTNTNMIRLISKDFLFKPSKILKYNVKQNACYVIINIKDGLFYIGSSGNIYSRINQHRCELRGNYHQAKRLQESFNKSNTYDFLISIIIAETREESLDIEQFLLDNFLSKNECTNTLINSRSSTGIFPTIEIRNKISNSLKGRIHSEETRKKIGLVHKGKIVTNETKLKQSTNAKGRGYDKELLKRMSFGNIGRKQSPETKLKRLNSLKRTLSIKHGEIYV
jgi:group I intron endonuclease